MNGAHPTIQRQNLSVEDIKTFLFGGGPYYDFGEMSEWPLL